MRLFSVVCCLVVLPGLVGFAPTAKLKRSISGYRGPQKWLLINSDGSGTVGYGAGGGPHSAFFPKGTFDVAAVEKQLKALPLDEKGKADTHYTYALESERKGPDRAWVGRYTKDRKLIDSLFEKGWKAGGKTSPFSVLFGRK